MMVTGQWRPRMEKPRVLLGGEDVHIADFHSTPLAINTKLLPGTGWGWGPRAELAAGSPGRRGLPFPRGPCWGGL